ncbi:MAG: UvrD-helicase domain-containing protein [Draconibacterium sp.]
MLTVYKASAGSGKTFQLVVEYLKLIIDNPYNYKHILAVTFTNKATNEMKSRILEQLHKLADNQPSDYIAPLQKEGDYSEQYIRQRARQVLKNILHDYNRFSINTIDSFTQKVIKSFNRELGISPNFSLELDTDIILEEATERMLARLGDDRDLLKWLQEYSREKIEGNYSQRIDKDIKDLGKELFKERFQVFFPEDGESVYNRETLNEFGKELQQLKGGFESTLKKKAYTLLQTIENHGFSVDDFSYKKSGVAGYIAAVAGGAVKEPTARAVSASEDVEKWYAKNHKQSAGLGALVQQNLQSGLAELILYFTTNFTRYNTSVVVLKQLRTLGILTDLRKEIEALLREKEMLQLSDSNLLLSKIIGESDSPFVYEKIGNFFYHFMLDEFQDTSGLQWRNFKPLVVNSLSEGHSNLVVGDVKQSIYRWRNSDWNILAEELDNDFTEAQKKEEHLDFNWRSDKNIIAFNNEIIARLMDVFESRLFSTIPDNESYLHKFRKIYASFQQKPGKEKAEARGFVQVNFLDGDDFYDTATDTLVEQVKMLQDKGIKPEEIAILVRRNSEGTRIVEAFLEAAQREENKNYNLTVLSNDSLFLFASKAVLFIIHTIEWLVDPLSEINKATLLHLWMSWLRPAQKVFENTLFAEPEEKWQLGKDYDTLFESELGEKLEQVKQKVLLSSLDETVTRIASLFGLLKLRNELPYIQTLIDKAGELKISLSNDLSNLLFWWNEKGSTTSVNVNEGTGSIRLLTVHSSKGLEFKAVLLPYFKWETSRSGDIIWCQPASEPFNKFPLLPVKSGKEMEASEFAPAYFEEKVSSYIDSLNLIYVAITRAKSALLMNCPAPKLNQKGEYSGSDVDLLLFLAIQETAANPLFSNSFDEETGVFEFGSVSPGEEKKAESKNITITQYRFSDLGDRISLRLSGEDFLLASDKHHSEKNIGKLVHEILSGINTVNDVEAACLKALNEGRVDKGEMLQIQQTIAENLQLPEVKSWFDGSLQTLNERDLLTGQKLLRPDRIMFSGDTAIVVDYKTGEKIPTKYNSQVKRYARTLKDSGFRKVTGYLWYLASSEVEKVCEL